MTNKLLYARSVPVTDSISIVVPTVGEILEDEDKYYALVSMLTAMPIDLMVQLDDAGIDWTTIDEYELFLLLFNGLKFQDTKMIFGDLDVSKFQMSVDTESNAVVLVDAENDLVIDRRTQALIAATLRKLHHLEKNMKKPGNAEAKKYMLDKARKKLKRNKNRKQDSQLESLIVALVNTEQFKYNFETVRDLTIYQFNESVRQVVKKIDYQNRMYGVYSGAINAKDLSPEDLNWLIHK